MIILNTTFWVIMAIFFWLLIACAVVCLILYVGIQLAYYKWDKIEREDMKISKTVGGLIEKKINTGGGFEEDQN